MVRSCESNPSVSVKSSLSSTTTSPSTSTKSAGASGGRSAAATPATSAIVGYLSIRDCKGRYKGFGLLNLAINCVDLLL